MLKNKLLYFGFFGAVLCLLAISALSLGFKAHAASPAAPAATTTIHANIITTKSGTVFRNPTITVLLKNAFAFNNDTNISQIVTSMKKTVLTIPAHSSQSYTFSKAGTYTFGLKSNPKATLTVTVK